MIFCVTDTETTGIDPQDHALVEIACLDVDGETYWPPQVDYVNIRSSLINPRRDIPPEASAVHHITDEDVRNAPLAGDVVPSILKPDRDDVIYVAHKADFEHGFLHHYLPADAQWLCTYKAALRLWPKAPGFSNQVLRYALGLRPEPTVADRAHRAGPDTYVTGFILRELLELVKLGKVTVEDMLAWSKEQPLLPVCPIGQKQGWKGKPWSEIDNGSLIWLSNVPDDEVVKWNAAYELSERARRMREAYVGGCSAAVRLARTVEDLKEWWQREADHRELHQITKDTPEYAKLAQMCVKKRDDLKAGVEEKLRPAERRMAA